MLREVWLDIGVEKVDMHKDITVKVLLDSSTYGNTTKGAAEEEAISSYMEKGATKKRIDNKGDSGNICGLWRM